MAHKTPENATPKIYPCTELIWLRWHIGTDDKACHGVTMVIKLYELLVCMYYNNRSSLESPSHSSHGVDLMVNLQWYSIDFRYISHFRTTRGINPVHFPSTFTLGFFRKSEWGDFCSVFYGLLVIFVLKRRVKRGGSQHFAAGNIKTGRDPSKWKQKFQ